MECPICYEEPLDGFLLECHISHYVCYTCGLQINKCPLCKKLVKNPKYFTEIPELTEPKVEKEFDCEKAFFVFLTILLYFSSLIPNIEFIDFQSGHSLNWYTMYHIQFCLTLFLYSLWI